jgi:Domain of unknown function (DUF222)/HNH endonuclease
MASAEVYERITHLQATMAQVRTLQADILDQIAEFERLQIAKTVGYPSTRALLMDAIRVAPHVATRMVAHSQLVAETLTPTGHVAPAPLPTVRAALHEGLLDPEHVAVVANAVKQLPDWASLEDRALVESTLAETARHHHARVVREQGEHLLARIDQDGHHPGEDDRQAEPGNWFRSQRDRTGRMRFRGELEPEIAEILEAMLGDLAKPQPLAPGIPDPRSVEERYGDAMSEVVFRAAYPRGSVQPALAVHLDLNMLLDGIGTATLDSGCPLSPQAVRRLCCDAGLIPIVLNGNSVPLDLGRTHRLVTPEQRRALVARDQCCAYPGCDLPARWADAHHIKPWSEGGSTNLDNLVLLCRRHHRTLHHPEWTIRMRQGHPEFIPPKWIDPQQRPMRNVIRQ